MSTKRCCFIVFLLCSLLELQYVAADANPSDIQPKSGDDGSKAVVISLVMSAGLLMFLLGGFASFCSSRSQRRELLKQQSIEQIESMENRDIILQKKETAELNAFEKLLSSDIMVAKAICKLVEPKSAEANRIAKDLVIIYEALNHRSTELINIMIADELETANEAGTLMRNNSIASKLLKEFSSLTGRPYLAYLFREFISEICENPKADGASFEQNPEVIPEGESQELNREKLLATCSKFLRRIFDSVDEMPGEFRQICHDLQQSVAAKFPGSAQSSIGGFLFLRYFCPSIIAPTASSIISVSPSQDAQRGLTLIAMILQNIANNSTFANKEEYLQPLNPFITSNFSACQDYFDSASILPDKPVPINYEVDPEEKKKSLHSLCTQLITLMPKITEMYEDKSFHSRLITILTDLKEILKEKKEIGHARVSLDLSIRV